ncbi:MAG: FAD-binding oxidoreductase [Gammaproteobacteria bacterium]|jgi:ferredoxin-NADP reductase
MHTFKLNLVNTYLLNDRTRHLEFKILNGIPLKFKPGQFISLHIEKNLEVVRRNYSIANTPTPDHSNKIEIALTFVPNGIASTILWNMQIGDHIKASGPFGIFVLKPEDLITTKRYILVATGTGVTPYRAMLNNLNQILEEQPDITVTLLLGVRDHSELLYGNEFINFANKQPKFKFIACYSRPKEPTNNIYEFQGYVQHKLTQLNIEPNKDLIYLCGNPNMVDEALATLEQLGVHKSKIRREKYISSK